MTTTVDRARRGELRRIGFIVPRSNTVCERELNRLAPPEVGFHAARMRFAAGTRADDMSAFFAEKLADPLEDLALCGVELTLLACSTATMAMTEEALGGLAARAPGGLVDVLDASSAALTRLGRPRVALFTPYVETGTAALRARLEAAGIEVVASTGLGLNTSPERFSAVSRTTPEALCDHVRAMAREGAEAVFIGCCDLPTLDAIPAREAELGLPVVSMIQALFASAMARVAPDMVLPWRPGRLLAKG